MATISLTLQQSGQTIPLGADDVTLPDIATLPTSGYSAIRYRFANTAASARNIGTFSQVANITGWLKGSPPVNVMALGSCECVEVMYNPQLAGWLVVNYSPAPRE